MALPGQRDTPRACSWRDTDCLCPPPGVRIFYVTKSWELRNRLLAVRQFNPTREVLQSNRLPGILQRYLGAVLDEYNIKMDSLFSATSDGDRHVMRLCDELLPGLSERCVCHIVGDSIAEVRPESA